MQKFLHFYFNISCFRNLAFVTMFLASPYSFFLQALSKCSILTIFPLKIFAHYDPKLIQNQTNSTFTIKALNMQSKVVVCWHFYEDLSVTGQFFWKAFVLVHETELLCCYHERWRTDEALATQAEIFFSRGKCRTLNEREDLGEIFVKLLKIIVRDKDSWKC